VDPWSYRVDRFYAVPPAAIVKFPMQPTCEQNQRRQMRQGWSGRTRTTLGVAVGSLVVLAACEGPLPTDVGPEETTRPPAGQAAGSASSGAVFYVHAHEDDWPLFMGDRTNASIQSGATVVFVYATAGDAGDPDPRYWQTREVGAQAAVDAITPAGAWSCAPRSVNAHPIQRCQKSSAAVVAYYMRMPDGNGGTGTGYGRGSLGILRDQGTPTTTIDGSTTYGSWQDFHSTLRQIVQSEAADHAASSIQVNAPDYDRTANLDDHPDHFATADAVRAAGATGSWNLVWYIDYQTRKLAVNLSDAAHAIKDSEFKAYDNTMVAAGYTSYDADPWYLAWRWRTYFRTVAASIVPPNAPTNLAAQAVSPSQINLTWADNATNESGFRVERASDNAGVAGTYSVIATLGANVTAYSNNTGLNAGTTYWYRMVAFNDAGNSGYSNQASATTLAPSGAPSNLTVARTVMKGNKIANLAWARGTATTIDVWRSGVKIVSTTNTGSYADNLGKPGGTFTYQVCIVGKTTLGDCSNTVTHSF
jgi:LmbE family N-acetylglucosaminyl deacetylase